MVSAIGEGMAHRHRRYRRGMIPVSPLWSTVVSPKDNEMTSMRARLGWGAQDVVFSYCGNLGHGHRWREFAEARLLVRDTRLRWVFVGGGARRSELSTWCSEHGNARIELLPYQSERDLPALLAAVDVHLVSVESGWEGVVVPSKIQNVLAVGRPVIVVGPQAAEPVRWIRESSAGWWVPIDDVSTMVSTVQVALNAGERDRRAQCARVVSQRRFGGQVSDRLVDLVESAALGPRWHGVSRS